MTSEKDAISKASVCEILSDLYGFDNERVVLLSEVSKAMDRIQGLPSVQPKSRWIPCSERLPEAGKTVLTFDGDCICVERRIERIDTPEGQLDGEWWIDGYDGDECNPINLRDGTVIAWMPLPDPYKARE